MLYVYIVKIIVLHIRYWKLGHTLNLFIVGYDHREVSEEKLDPMLLPTPLILEVNVSMVFCCCTAAASTSTR